MIAAHTLPRRESPRDATMPIHIVLMVLPLAAVPIHIVLIVFHLTPLARHRPLMALLSLRAAAAAATSLCLSMRSLGKLGIVAAWRNFMTE